jgi:hypothetical protein
MGLEPVSGWSRLSGNRAMAQRNVRKSGINDVFNRTKDCDFKQEIFDTVSTRSNLDQVKVGGNFASDYD